MSLLQPKGAIAAAAAASRISRVRRRDLHAYIVSFFQVDPENSVALIKEGKFIEHRNVHLYEQKMVMTVFTYAVGT